MARNKVASAVTMYRRDKRARVAAMPASSSSDVAQDLELSSVEELQVCALVPF